MKTSSVYQWLLVITLLAASAVARAEYANVNGINMYYEVQGSGTPVVMLHGGYDDADMWNYHAWVLSFKYKVITIDSRGHGRSEIGKFANTEYPQPITYEVMIDDTLALLDQLGVGRAHFVGWSDGAVIASYIAAKHPEKVNKLVMFGTVYQSDQYIDAFGLLLNQPVTFLGAMDLLYRARWERLNPNPELWTDFSASLYMAWMGECYLPGQYAENCLEPLESINRPTLVVAGEQEIIKRAHTEEIANRIPGAELKIVPLASHYLPKFRPILATNIISKFLNN